MSDPGPAGSSDKPSSDKPSSDKPSSDKPQASNVRWQFIDSSNNSRSNLTQVKRHVMQEYMRQKKGDSQQAKRGRPKATRAAKRKSTRKATQSTPQDPQSTNETNQSPAVSKQDALADIEDSGQGRIVAVTTSSNPYELPAQAQSITHLPYRASSIQPYNPFDPQRLMNISPQTHSYPTDFSSSLASWSSAPTTPLDFTQSPRSIMSAARTDPFNTLPIELDLDGQRLFDFYVNDMPACSYGTHFRSLKAHNWYTAVFVPEAMKGAVAFQNTILVHAANTWAWVRNEGETADGLLHRDRAIRMLREHMYKNPGDTSDVAIISCLSAAALEDFDPRLGRKEFSWMHMRAARDMIRARGGPAAFANTRLGMLINWQDYILSGYETRGLSFSFEPTPSFTPTVSAEPLVQPPQISQSIPSPPYSTSSLSDTTPCSEPPPVATNSLMQLSPIDEIRLQCEEFLDLLRRCEQLALYQKANPESCDLSRHTSVQESSLLFQILSAPPGARFTASGDRKQMVARFTALMILNAALWDYRYAPIHAGTFLRTLEYAMIDSEVSMSGSVEAILQILLACNDGYVSVDHIISSSMSDELPDFTQYSSATPSPSARPWFAGRMLKIAKRLGADSWHQISDLLFYCLTLQVSEYTVHSWEPDLRREILEAPLTSYTMPSLLE
ncbi:hypothetical protein N7509_009188 [Penicillium cosmopolitanum]|uniref:Sigma-70 region 2 family protein n=1 Tax=Penicillium cosmopolitanum TaxID=1131564 RepID=A0A9X0B3E6_9EURO|nr:uncharacterized protein N7509_009188 [Penicillium cosmopolitanum]KAJ5386647.1 hypothetical protein N7509_009188 [Penicillium cosmopolitanum]